MKRYRWLTLVLIAVTSAVILWKIFHSRSGREGMSSQAASRLERSPVGPVDPDVKLDPGLRHKARGNGEDRIRFRAREQALARIIEQIEALEVERIFDRSRSVKDPIMTELLKNQYGLKNSKSPVIIEVHQLAMDAPSLEQAEFIRRLIRDQLPQQLFDDIAQREAAIIATEDRYLNFKNKMKLIERNCLIVEGAGIKEEWISAYDTDEIMQIEKPEGAHLSPKVFGEGIDTSVKNDKGRKWNRYGYLFKDGSETANRKGLGSVLEILSRGWHCFTRPAGRQILG